MLLAFSTPLPSGLRVRLRLLHGSDRAALRALHERAGLEIDDVGLGRLFSVDPLRRIAIVATAWSGSEEAIVGFAIGDRGAEAEQVIVDSVAGPELAAVLTAALAERGAVVPRVA